MKKYYIIIFLLILIDLFAYRYFISIESNKKILRFNDSSNSLIYQFKEIEITNIDNFNFYDFFKTVNCSNYKYNFNDNYINIFYEGKEYSIQYKIIEPIVIEKVVYKEIEKTITDDKRNIDSNQEPIYVQNNYFNVNSSYLLFSIDDSFDYIRDKLYQNINTTYETTIDYSNLIIGYVGQYEVSYISPNETIKIIVEIS